MSSPLIIQLAGIQIGRLRGKDNVRRYREAGLQRFQRWYFREEFVTEYNQRAGSNEMQLDGRLREGTPPRKVGGARPQRCDRRMKSGLLPVNNQNSRKFEMWKETEVARRLGLAVPIVQGPFGGGVSSTALTAAVCNAGGLGSFGAHLLAPDQIKELCKELRARTKHPFALNLWMPFEGSEHPPITDEEFVRNAELLQPYYDEVGATLPARPERFGPKCADQIEALLEARPAVFSFIYGVPSPEVLLRCKELGIVTLGTATTVDEAVVLDRAGVDIIVATGFEAGGHRVSFLRPAEDSLFGTFALLPQVVDAVKAPVIAAGGIADGRGIAAALALGAQGVQVGTAFLACEESGASSTYRQMLFSPEAKSTALTRAFTGRLARAIQNRFMVEQSAHESELPCYPVQSWFTGPLRKAANSQGNPDFISMWAGQSASLIRRRHASVLMEKLIEETAVAIGRFSR